MALTDTSIGNLSGCRQLMHLRVHGEDEDAMSRETRRARLDAGRTASKKRPRPKMPVMRASVLCFSLVLIAGCGSTTTKTTAAAPTKAQYIASADAICHSLGEKNKALSAEENAVKISAELDLSESKKDAEEADARLRALPQPLAGASTIAEWLHWRERATASSGSASSFKEDIAATTKASSIAKAYGFRSCAELPESNAKTTATAPAATTTATRASSPQLLCVEAKGYTLGEVRPSSCVITAPGETTSERADVVDLHWTSWGSTNAAATGEYRGVAVRVYAYDVKPNATTGGPPVFTQININNASDHPGQEAANAEGKP
jgi:hypothetical protein